MTAACCWQTVMLELHSSYFMSSIILSDYNMSVLTSHIVRKPWFLGFKVWSQLVLLPHEQGTYNYKTNEFATSFIWIISRLQLWLLSWSVNLITLFSINCLKCWKTQFSKPPCDVFVYLVFCPDNSPKRVTFQRGMYPKTEKQQVLTNEKGIFGIFDKILKVGCLVGPCLWQKSCKVN